MGFAWDWGKGKDRKGNYGEQLALFLPGIKRIERSVFMNTVAGIRLRLREGATGWGVC
jgi:hypothetical protein